MPSFRLIPIEHDHLPDLGRICYEAFSTLQRRHGAPLDFECADEGFMVLSLLANRPDYIGVAAVEQDRHGRQTLIGSNFLQTADTIAGLGPITVDPRAQSRGVGRALMQHIIDQARDCGRAEVRLFQEAINTASLPLYTSLGFSWVDSAALMTPPKLPAGHSQADPSVRAMTRDDLPAVAELSEATYGYSRAEDAGILLDGPFSGFVRQRGGRIVGYLFPSMLGHAGARTDDDLIAMLTVMGHRLAGPPAKFICPLSEVDLFRALLARGARVLKILNYMSYGNAYRPPRGSWLPSIQC